MNQKDTPIPAAVARPAQRTARLAHPLMPEAVARELVVLEIPVPHSPERFLAAPRRPGTP